MGLIDNAVETLHISASDAMGRFAGKNLDAAGVDFSDRIKGGSGAGAGRGRGGYVAWSGDLELVNRSVLHYVLLNARDVLNTVVFGYMVFGYMVFLVCFRLYGHICW